MGIFNVSLYLAQTCHPMPVSGPPHCLSQNGTFCIYKKVDCQNLRKLGEICLGYKYNFRDNYCYFDKRNVSYCIFNDATVARQKYGSFVKHGSYSISFLFLWNFGHDCIRDSEKIGSSARKEAGKSHFICLAGISYQGAALWNKANEMEIERWAFLLWFGKGYYPLENARN